LRILTGNKIKEVDSLEFESIIKEYKALVIDIGTGEGEFIYKKARQDKEVMYIGIDTSADSMLQYSVKSAKRPEKGGIKNIMFVVANAEDLPDTLSNTADKIFINLPWGSLRDGIIKGEHSFLSGIEKIAKENATLDIYVSYCGLYEKQEIENRQLPALTVSYLCNNLKARYKKYGINIVHISVLDNEGLKKIETRWAKKLGYGKKRDVFYLKCKIQK
jgi:16S rRNA (adenine(1408)-N(1))-methyltransferase